MDIIYCNIGEMQDYNGSDTERPVGGGEYNSREIGHEVNNFTKSKGKYYGFVQSSSGTIAVDKHFSCVSSDGSYAEHILVIWVVDKKKIVGWYKDATIYREWTYLDKDTAANRKYDDYNVMAEEVTLLPEQDRKLMQYSFGRNNIWYGEDDADKKTVDFIEQYESGRNAEIDSINSSKITGAEREILTKQRINQSKFRQSLLKKYNGKCALCGVLFGAVLVASHIKPWSESDPSEKVDSENGLLLCPHHDKLFDAGYISFDDEGKILISSQLDMANRIKLNVVSDMHIRITNRMIEFIKYHRKNRFKE